MGACRAVIALVVVTGCSDPSFDVDIGFESIAGLQASTATLTVSVLDADAVAAGIDATANQQLPLAGCDAIAFGMVSPDVLIGARQASAVVRDGVHLSGVPRLGDKLVLVEALDANGRRIGAGCTAWGDVDGDVRVAVRVEAAPMARVVSGSTSGFEPESIGLLLTAAWDSALPLGDRVIRVETYTATGLLPEVRTDETDPVTGRVDTTAIEANQLGAPGPVQTLIRSRWASDLIRIPWFHGRQLPNYPKDSNDNWAIANAGRWVMGPIGTNPWAAVTVDGDEVLGVYFDAPELQMVRTSQPDVEAVGIHQAKVFTILDDGWYWLGLDGTRSSWSAVPPQEHVVAIDVVEPCPDDPGDGGVLARERATSGAETYRALPWPGGSPSTTLDAAAATLNALSAELVGQVCITRVDPQDGTSKVQRHLIARAMIGLWLIGPDDVERLVANNAVTAFPIEVMGGLGTEQQWTLAGVEATLTGARAYSYQRVSQPISGLVLDGVIDRGLAAPPTSMVVVQHPDDATDFTVVAALPTGVGARLQVSTPTLVAGEPLTGVSAAIPGTRRGSADAVLHLDDVDRDGGCELVVTTPGSFDVYRIGMPTVCKP